MWWEQAWNPDFREVEAGWSGVQGHSQLPNNCGASLDCMMPYYCCWDGGGGQTWKLYSPLSRSVGTLSVVRDQIQPSGTG